MISELSITPIGCVECKVLEGIDEGWGSIESKIILYDKYSSGLSGLEDFSHALVVFFMHESTFEPENHLMRRPQGREDLPILGIFSQRAKHRPNPIGITSVEIIGVENNILTVRGLDAINGTPVLDIKPYIPQFDTAENPVVPEWVDKIMAHYF